MFLQCKNLNKLSVCHTILIYQYKYLTYRKQIKIEGTLKIMQMKMILLKFSLHEVEPDEVVGKMSFLHHH